MDHINHSIIAVGESFNSISYFQNYSFHLSDSREYDYPWKIEVSQGTSLIELISENITSQICHQSSLLHFNKERSGQGRVIEFVHNFCRVKEGKHLISGMTKPLCQILYKLLDATINQLNLWEKGKKGIILAFWFGLIAYSILKSFKSLCLCYDEYLNQ